MSLPNGPTVHAHVEQSLLSAEDVMSVVSAEIRTMRRLSRRKRIALSRRLAGVVSDVESIRVWLEGGAPK